VRVKEPSFQVGTNQPSLQAALVLLLAPARQMHAVADEMMVSGPTWLRLPSRNASVACIRKLLG
jgi:hypothetical protein